MAIACRRLYEDFSNSIGQTYGNDRLQGVFIRACNMALSDLSYDADLATNLTQITSIDDSIAIDSSYAHILFAGVSYFATRLGVRPADPKIATIVYQDTERMWNKAKGQYARSIDNAIQPDRSSSLDDIGYLDAE